MEYDEYNDTVDKMQATWNFLSLPNKEATIKGKLLGVYFAAKLSVAIHVPCFLVDEDALVGALVMICLKQKWVQQLSWRIHQLTSLLISCLLIFQMALLVSLKLTLSADNVNFRRRFSTLKEKGKKALI